MIFSRLQERCNQKAAILRRRTADAYRRQNTHGNPRVILIDEPTEGWLADCQGCSGYALDSPEIRCNILMVEQNFKAAIKVATGSTL